ncbi:YggT family protein [Propionibacterium australiense]|uniref:YGGT family n=1 Tax=Propionibacterium australiense TaxID=119981 RepID=A0A383S529_9ACTN|nr:YggT family protein [Propionibacterium australiense]RLP11169.1 YggT family protein [Propionibacterium australiense]RLP12498.1 YggT family protein [Propionibacterium australiense]SYZ32682.1 YGGT family [Propionibacterium australiense]VEH91563.1 YGGT family [Propionibacterium australiense]
MLLLARVLSLLCTLYIWVLIARMIISWIPLLVPDFRPKGAAAAAFEAIYTLTDPPITFVRRYIKPIRIGTVGLDVAFMVVFLALVVLRRMVWLLV